MNYTIEDVIANLDRLGTSQDAVAQFGDQGSARAHALASHCARVIGYLNDLKQNSDARPKHAQFEALREVTPLLSYDAQLFLRGLKQLKDHARLMESSEALVR
jgi:hypothetical protein